MVSQSIKLGGTASDISVGPRCCSFSYGVVASPVSDEQAFEAIKAGVDALPAGTKMFLNSGEFYDSKRGTGNLQLLSRFYNKYPEYTDKTFLSVKGAIKLDGGKVAPDCSMENLRRSVDNIQKELGPIKKLDLFQPARIDRNVPVETLMNNLVALLKEGKFSHIGLSECNANTLRKAHSIYPITAAEIEVSAWAYEKEQKDVIAAATELNISVLAYSPLGRGVLTGTIKSLADLPEGDHRARLDCFKEENFQANLAIVNGLQAIADKKGITTGQLAIAWVASLGPTMIPLPGSSKASRTLENLQGGDVELTAEELKGIADVLAAHPVAGERYFGAAVDMYLWG
ncbi:aldo/keto reductase [Gymnopus androsaceus JB14]|uniref:Aldo/keto reductase n=1 Tax=Gymnopus androsaceus JB14 TaxID=1447944 RepID=A0A6A4HFV5_9AGAR|nr:aldo/keto reductase [Gymnopus androsaceus JB14]